MAFKNKTGQKEKVELVSLIDMIFILLVFFLVTSFVIRMPLQERSLHIPTPENTVGRAQIVVQLIDEDRVFWLDEQASQVVSDVEDNYGYLPERQLKNRIISALIEKNIFSYGEFERKLVNWKNRASQDPFSRYFVMIRCPNHTPYFRVIDVITKLTDTPFQNIKYGCVGGTLEQLRNCRRVYTVVSQDAKGKRRKNIRFDF